MIRSKRTKPRPGRVKGAEMAELRQAAWERDKGICQFCFTPANPANWQLAHKRAKRRHGDDIHNVHVSHPICHHLSHVYGATMTKPCPPKNNA